MSQTHTLVFFQISESVDILKCKSCKVKKNNNNKATGIDERVVCFQINVK